MSVRAWITLHPLDPWDLLSRVGTPADGAVLLFQGIVRNENEGRRVVAIEYEAYSEMAEKELAQIAAEAAERAGTDRIVVAHRVGNLGVGETSVAIAVSSPHRAESFDACRYVIEEIKKRVPIWKREQYEGEDARWLDGALPEAGGEAPR